MRNSADTKKIVSVEKLELNSVPLDIPLKHKIKHLLQEWILSSTSHGLPSVFRTDQLYLKAIWFFCFLLSTAACIYFIVSYIITYFQYGVTVSTTIETETPIDFPAITICNLNPFYVTRAISFVQETLTRNNFTYLLTLSNLTTGQTAFSLSKTVLEVLRSDAATNPAYNATSRKELGFYIDDMLVSCTYSGSECSSSDFDFFQSYEYGNCYTFNSGSNSTKTISSAGPGHGLEIELFAGDPHSEIFIYKRGFYVVVHNQSTSPIMDNEGVYVSIGTETNIGVERTFNFKLPSPYSSCISDPTSNTSSTSELYLAILNDLGEKSYRQKYCYKLCYQMEVIKACDCYDPQYATYGNSTVRRPSCRLTAEVICMETAATTFEQNDVKTKCADYCPQECTNVKYSTSVHTASYPTDQYTEWLKLQNNFISKFSNQGNLATQIQHTVAKINVFYNDISYIALTEAATISWDSVIGNVGGQLGLFIGISVLSVVELVEAFCEVIRTIYLHKRTNKIRNN
jgi:hypothetical protein